MIAIENLQKSFGGQLLFDGLSFRINSRERIGLVGRNGHGKTTLFRMITGLETPDTGGIIIPKNYRIGYVEQHIAFTQDTVLKEGMTGLPPADRDHHWKVEKILAGLGFSENDMGRHPSEFSGGYQVRLNLAKVLVSEPDLLLLDEPTNYLDIASIRWIERFLVTWPREILLITHDRGFMDQVVTHIVGIYRQKAKKIDGNTEKYYTQLAQEEEIHEKTRINDERRRKEIELFITRFRAKARLAGLVQSRVKTLAKMEKKEKLQPQASLEFSFRYKPFKARHMLLVDSLCFAYPQNPAIIQGLNFTLRPGERVCVVGKNGQGKTTLLKLLAGALAPDAGAMDYQPTVERGFYEQTNVQSLVDERTVEEEILYCDKAMDRQKARNICGAMMFSGDSAIKKISVLSGGEKARVMLGKLLATPLNLLLLDEPTNHLDMDACDALLEAIDAFDGAVIMVTHNEMFLHALADRLIVFQNNEVTVFDGSYQRFLESGGWIEEGAGAKTPTQPLASPNVEKLSKKQLRLRRSEIVSERSKVLRPLEQEVARIENQIETAEKELALQNDQMIKASQSGEGKKIAAISREIRLLEETIERLFGYLEEKSDALDQHARQFDEKLAQLESDGETSS
jgi:ATP-binding cassette, subfamily F, member 3